MPTGVVTFVDPVGAGASELSAAVLSTDVVLPVGDAGGFDEEFEERRYLTIGDDLTPHEYVAVENDDDTQQTVTLAAPVGTAYEAGLPVYLWDPKAEGTDKRAVEYEAEVRLEGQTNPIPATVRHTLIPLSGVDTLDGARVTLEEDEDGEWYVANVLGREPILDGSTLDPATLPDASPAQTFSADEPTSTDGFAENHAWWQVVDNEVLGFWRLTGGAWVEAAIVSGEAAYFQNALIDALQVTGLNAVNIEGGSIYIAQGEDASEPETFSGTSLPVGWTSTKVGPEGSGSPGASVPGVSVVSSGPAGQSGSALLVDYGASGLTGSTAQASGEVYTSIGLSANAEISARFRCTLGSDFVYPDEAYLAIRSSDGAAFSPTWDAVTLSLIGAGSFRVDVWTNGAQANLGSVIVPADPTSEWVRTKFRVVAGQVLVKVWEDGTTEPSAWTSFQQTTISAVGRASLAWRQYPAISNSRGQDVWLDEFNVTTYASGFTVNADGSGEWPAIGLAPGDADWREVGAVGEPAFENGWSASVGETLVFRKSPTGDVTITTGGLDIPASAHATTIFTLPAGYWPTRAFPSNLVFQDASGTQPRIAGVTINTNGTVVWRDLGNTGAATTIMTISYSAL